jgi:hypothetical protein
VDLLVVVLLVNDRNGVPFICFGDHCTILGQFTFYLVYNPVLIVSLLVLVYVMSVLLLVQFV